MAVGYERGLSGNSLSIDYTGKQRAQRVFYVATLDPIAAREADNVPRINAGHPLNADLIVDTIDTQPDGNNGGTVVTCTYSTYRNVQFRVINRDNPVWYHWGWAQEQVMIDIPIAVRKQITTIGQDGSPEFVKVWTIEKKQVKEYRVVRPLQVRVVTRNVRTFDVIHEQTNKLHQMPDGKIYLFRGGSVNQVDDAPTGPSYDISYNWIYDAGTTKFPAWGDENASYCTFFENGNPSQRDLQRDPYTLFLAYQVYDPRYNEPRCILSKTYDNTDLQGWRLLPGATRIA